MEYSTLTTTNILPAVAEDDCQAQKPYIVSALYPVITPEEEEYIEKQIEFFRYLLENRSITQELRVLEAVA